MQTDRQSKSSRMVTMYLKRYVGAESAMLA